MSYDTTLTAQVTFDIAGPVACLTFQNGRGNRLTANICKELRGYVETAMNEPDVRVILIASAGAVFSKGVDLDWLDAETPLLELTDLCHAIESCSKPVIAALQADAYGAAMDLALAAHFRIAAPSVNVAFDHILLGLPPAGGASQRLPRLVGAKASLQLLLSGAKVRASALSQVFNAEIAGQFSEGAMRFADAIAAQGIPASPTSECRDGFADPFGFQSDISSARADLPKGETVKNEIIQCVEASCLLPMSAGIEREAEAFADCITSRQSRALRYATRLANRAEDQTEALANQVDKIRHLAVVGLGTQGRAIAVASLLAGVRVTLLVTDNQETEAVKASVLRALSQSVSQMKLGDDAGAQASILLEVVDQMHDCEDAQLLLIAEAPNKVDTVQLFEMLGEVLPRNAVMATTHSLEDVDLHGEASGRDMQVLGMFFGTPISARHQVEIARGEKTDDFAVATAGRFVSQLGRTCSESLYTPGGIPGTVQVALWQAMEYLLRQGASFTGIDAALRALGFAKGPFQSLDAMGMVEALKVSNAVLQNLQGAGAELPFLKAMVEVGLMGARSGKGFYLHLENEQSHAPNPEAIKLVHGLRGERREAIAKADIQNTCIAAMANMGAGLCREGLVAQPSDIDRLVGARLGFTARRGGPMQACDHIGLLKVRNLLSELAKQDVAFEPDPLLDDLIKNGQTFAHLNRWA